MFCGYKRTRLEALFRSKHKNYLGHTQNHTFLTRQDSLLRRHPAARACLFSRDATLVDTSQRQSSECQHRYIFPSAILILHLSVHMASFGQLSVQILIKPFSSSDTPSRSHCKFAPIWLHLVTFLSKYKSSHFQAQKHLSKSCCRSASIWLHLETFLCRCRSSHFQAQVHLPKSITNLLPYGFIWTPFCPNIDQAIFEPRYTFPKPLQICSHMASFGHLSVQVWIRPFSNPDTPFQNCCRSASIWLHLDTFLSRYRSSHFQAQVHLPKSIANEKPFESYASCN